MSDYMNPGVAASRGMEAFLAEQAATARQQRLDQIARDREDRMNAHDDFEMSQAKDKAARDNFARKIANLMPGDMPDAQTIAESERLGVPLAVAKQPRPEIGKAGMGDVNLPTVDPMDMNKPTDEKSAQLPMTPEQPPPLIKFLGTPAQRSVQAQQDLRKSLADNIRAGMDPNEIIAGYMEQGGDPKEAESIIATLKPKTQSVYRIGKDRRGIESLVNGQWQPLTEGVDKDAHWIQEPTPSTTNVNVTPTPASPDETAWKVDNFINTGAYPAMGSGNSAATRRDAFDKAVSARLKELNLTGADIAKNKAHYDADRASLTGIQKNVDAVNSFMATADKNSKDIDKVLDRIPDSGYEIVNKVWRPLASNFSDQSQKDIATFNSFRNSLQNEYARIVSQPSLSGQLTDSARRDMETVIDPNAPISKVKAALAALRREGENREESYSHTLDTIDNRTATATPSGAGTTTTNPAETPEQRVQRIRKKHGL